MWKLRYFQTGFLNTHLSAVVQTSPLSLCFCLQKKKINLYIIFFALLWYSLHEGQGRMNAQVGVFSPFQLGWLFAGPYYSCTQGLVGLPGWLTDRLKAAQGCWILMVILSALCVGVGGFILSPPKTVCACLCTCVGIGTARHTSNLSVCRNPFRNLLLWCRAAHQISHKLRECDFFFWTFIIPFWF